MTTYNCSVCDISCTSNECFISYDNLATLHVLYVLCNENFNNHYNTHKWCYGHNMAEEKKYFVNTEAGPSDKCLTSLHSDRIALKSNLDDAEENITDLQTRLELAEASIIDYETRISNLESIVVSLQALLS